MFHRRMVQEAQLCQRDRMTHYVRDSFVEQFADNSVADL